ncbi:MAG: zinc ribbon domain-containing protein [Sandaracinaceae bacterium]|nr:zinc ribbon domain-containing protein [Sandaracinaceae bacterium]
MPTYEYACSACGNEWEKEQRISENPVRKCPKCGKNKAQRLISGGNFILKGDGWYADLYSKPPTKKKAKESSESSSESSSTPAATETAKPEKKAKKKKASDAA